MKTKRWEYTVQYDLTEFDLGDYGQAGWELCSVVRGSTSYIYYLKRRVE